MELKGEIEAKRKYILKDTVYKAKGPEKSNLATLKFSGRLDKKRLVDVELVIKVPEKYYETLLTLLNIQDENRKKIMMELWASPQVALEEIIQDVNEGEAREDKKQKWVKGSGKIDEFDDDTEFENDAVIEEDEE